MAALSTTTLSTAVTAGSQQWPLASISSVTTITQAGGIAVLFAGGEACFALSAVGNTANVQRGMAGSTNSAQASGATVYIGTQSQFYQSDPMGVAPTTPETTPWINTVTGAIWTASNGVWVQSNGSSSGGTITSPSIVTPTITGASTFTGVFSGATTITSTTLATTRYLLSAVTITPTSTFSVTGGGSVAGVRGEVTLTTGKSFTDGFLYGVQGKFILNGTIAEVSAARIVGVLGQLDLASGTVTAGQVSAIWADLQGTSPTLTVPDQINVLRVTNSTASTINAMAFFYGQSTYFFTCGRDGGTPTYFGATAPTSLAKSLKIDVGGTSYYIGLYTAAS